MSNVRKSSATWQRLRASQRARLTRGGFANRTDAKVRGRKAGSK